MKRMESLQGSISRVERDCQTVRRESRIIHHREGQYRTRWKHNLAGKNWKHNPAVTANLWFQSQAENLHRARCNSPYFAINLLRHPVLLLLRRMLPQFLPKVVDLCVLFDLSFFFAFGGFCASMKHPSDRLSCAVPSCKMYHFFHEVSSWGDTPLKKEISEKWSTGYKNT